MGKIIKGEMKNNQLDLKISWIEILLFLLFVLFCSYSEMVKKLIEKKKKLRVSKDHTPTVILCCGGRGR